MANASQQDVEGSMAGLKLDQGGSTATVEASSLTTSASSTSLPAVAGPPTQSTGPAARDLHRPTETASSVSQGGDDDLGAASNANGSGAVAQLGKPEASDGSTNAVSLTAGPVASPEELHQVQRPSQAGIEAVKAVKDPVVQAIAAVKCRDFAMNPPPARPVPTTLGQHLSNAVLANGSKGMASAPAVPTLSSATPATSTTSSGKAAAAAASTSSASNPQQTPLSTSAPSSSHQHSGLSPVRPAPPVPRASQPTPTGSRRPPIPGGSGSLASRIPPSLQAKMAAMASRSNNPTSVALTQSTNLATGERIQQAPLFRHSSSSSSSGSSASAHSASTPASSPPTPFGSSAMPPFAMRQSVGSAAHGRVGAMGPLAGRGPVTGPAFAGPGGGLAKRRGPGGGLTLAAMGASVEDGTPGGSDASSSGPLAAGPSSSAAPSNSSTATPGPTTGPGRQRPRMQLPGGINGVNGSAGVNGGPGGGGAGRTAFSNFSRIVDPSGSLNFQNKAVLHAKGVDFSNGSSFNINMDDLELQDELGAGNYGTVQKVYHKVTKVTMAMKEIRLELDDSKLKAIITELDILHRATAPEIVDFYGAFFIESCVYYCMEYMDAGSLDKLAGYPVPEPVLKRVTASMVRGLKFLKDELQTMHRDVKPTNVLINQAGAIKLCDFGISVQLERSLAKTNIGCQSYMAPERIKGESLNFVGTYTVSSDVWSLGLSIIEFTVGHYPYPPETYSNVFAQLQAIVHGDPPGLPDGFSAAADDFVAGCLHKDANKRPTYAQMLQHPFLKDEPTLDVDMAGWVREALAFKRSKKAGGPASAGATSGSGTASGTTSRSSSSSGTPISATPAA